MSAALCNSKSSFTLTKVHVDLVGFHVLRLLAKITSHRRSRVSGVSSSGTFTSTEESISKSESDSSDIDEEVEKQQLQLTDDPTRKEYQEFLASLDPRLWKQQDHYKILCLEQLRYKAKESVIRQVYRKIVLIYHPDKRKEQYDCHRLGDGCFMKFGNDDYYTCITKAYEILSNRKKRRSYDSVDEFYDNAIPPPHSSGTPLPTPEEFFAMFGPIFERESRFSIQTPVPLLGDLKTPFSEVEYFYTFWYSFDSWREYSYLDHEDKEQGECREERRAIELDNRRERIRKKRNDQQRISNLVDRAYVLDPRVALHKKVEKEKKEKAKQAKRELAKKRAAEQEELRRKEKDERLRIQAEKEAKELAEKEEQKRLNEAHKKLTRKERRLLRKLISQDFKYFLPDVEKEVSGAEEKKGWSPQSIEAMDKLSKLVEWMSLEQLKSLNDELKSATSIEVAKDSYLRYIKMLEEDETRQKEKHIELLEKTASRQSSGLDAGRTYSSRPWSEAETELLIKAVNLFAPGTVNRWDTIATFINQHNELLREQEGSENISSQVFKRTGKEALSRAKELQKLDISSQKSEQLQTTSKEEVPLLKQRGKTGRVGSQKKSKVISGIQQSEFSQRYMTPGEVQAAELGTNAAPWTSEEQRLLEQGLKTFAASLPDRWDKIAANLETRSRKDCILRYKELVASVKAKKLEAQKLASQSNK